MSIPSSSNESQGGAFATAESLLAAIIDSSDDAIVSKNLNGVVTSWNRGAERTFGYTAQEMIGQPILRLIPPGREEEEPQILAKLRRGEQVDHFETVRVCKDGRHIDVSLTISPVKNAQGEIVGASKIARNITETRRAMRALAEAHEALRHADRMKTEFISTLSHELRTPLTAISGWLQILESDASPEEVAEGVQVIKRNVKTQSQLISDLLDMSRIESGKLALDIQRVDLPTIVAAAVESVMPAAQAKSIRLTKAFSSVEGFAMADKNRLQQVIWNLVTNAIKFTPKGGWVHVTIHRVNSHVEIEVTDSGVGIPANILPNIFERFVQGDSSTTRRHGGLGLGLSIAKHLTEMQGGSVTARSEGADRGATFTIKLPLLSAHYAPERTAAEHRNAAVDAATPSRDLETIKVLLVDDEPDALDVVRRILVRRGAHVETALDMASALDAFVVFAPHVVVSDIGMPGHDGYELIAKLRALPGADKIPAVALTALARSEDRTRALRAGFQVHVAKPIDADELVAIVHNLASLRGAQS